jgi:hypothetical protein
MGSFSHVDMVWDDPQVALFLRRRAALLADGPEAGPMALFFAGTRPERTSALILADATARYRVADDYPIGVPSETAEAMIDCAERLWGHRGLRAQPRRRRAVPALVGQAPGGHRQPAGGPRPPAVDAGG